MSYVHNVIILASCLEEFDETETYPAIDRLNKRLKEISYGAEFKEVSQHAGGNKVMERLVFLSAFGSYYDRGDFERAIKDAEWAVPEDVQVFVAGPDDWFFSQIVGESASES